MATTTINRNLPPAATDPAESPRENRGRVDKKSRKEVANQALALLNKIAGSKFESGAQTLPPNEGDSVGIGDNSTEISSVQIGEKGFWNRTSSPLYNGAARLFSGCRAALDFGGAIRSKENQVNAHVLNLKMMDYQLYRQMNELTKIMFDEDGGSNDSQEVASLRQEIKSKVDGMIDGAQMLDSYGNDPNANGEKQSLKKLLAFVLNEDGNDIKSYLDKVTDINKDTTDNQSLKVLTDAKNRYRATFQNLGLSAATKALAIATAPVTGFLGGVGIAAAVETTGQSLIKYNMESATLRDTIDQINIATNKELAHFFVIEDGLPVDKKLHIDQENAEQPPLAQYDSIKTKFQTAEQNFRNLSNSSFTQAQVQQITNDFITASNKLVSISFYILNNYQTIADPIAESGATISVSNLDRWKTLRAKVVSINADLVHYKLNDGFDRGPSAVLNNLKYVENVRLQGNDVVFGTGEKVINATGTQSEIIRSNAMEAISNEESQRLETFRTTQLNQVKGQIMKQATGKFLLNSASAAMAIGAAGFHAMRTAEALNGQHMIGVTQDAAGNNWMQLHEYGKAEATKAFEAQTGLGSKFGFSGMGSIGDAINSGAGNMFSFGTVLWNKLGLDNKAFMDQWHEGTQNAQAFGEVKKNTGILDMINPVSGEKYDFVRGFDFGGRYGAAMNIPEWLGYIGTGALGLKSVAEATKADQTDVNYDNPYGFHSPKFDLQQIRNLELRELEEDDIDVEPKPILKGEQQFEPPVALLEPAKDQKLLTPADEEIEFQPPVALLEPGKDKPALEPAKNQTVKQLEPEFVPPIAQLKQAKDNLVLVEAERSSVAVLESDKQPQSDVKQIKAGRGQPANLQLTEEKVEVKVVKQLEPEFSAPVAQLNPANDNLLEAGTSSIVASNNDKQLNNSVDKYIQSRNEVKQIKAGKEEKKILTKDEKLANAKAKIDKEIKFETLWSTDMSNGLFDQSKFEAIIKKIIKQNPESIKRYDFDIAEIILEGVDSLVKSQNRKPQDTQEAVLEIQHIVLETYKQFLARQEIRDRKIKLNEEYLEFKTASLAQIDQLFESWRYKIPDTAKEDAKKRGISLTSYQKYLASFDEFSIELGADKSNSINNEVFNEIKSNIAITEIEGNIDLDKKLEIGKKYHDFLLDNNELYI